MKSGRKYRWMAGVLAVTLFVSSAATYAAEIWDDPLPYAYDIEADGQGEAGVTELTLDKENLTLNVAGQTVTLTLDGAGSSRDVTWESSDTSVVKVEQDRDDPAQAVVTAVADGTAEIKVSADVGDAGGFEPVAVCTVTVSLFNGLNKDPVSGDVCFYTNGSVDTSKTDVMKGTVDGVSGWWNVVKGVVSGNTVAKNSNGWWYIDAAGMVDFDYNGFAENKNGLWYCENGKVTFEKQDIIKDSTGAIGAKGTWYYVIDSKVQTSFTGLSNFRNSNGWWYIVDGAVDFSHNGVDKNVNGWWYVTGGRVQLSYTGLADYKNANGWWYIKNGKVDFTANTVAKNKNGWYYVKNGKVDFSYNGFSSNGNEKWYLENGKVTFEKNSVIKDGTGAIGTKGTWYYVVGSKVQTSFTGLADYKNSNGWWYIKKGQVDFTHNGVDKNKNGWWYVVGGKVDFSYTGLADYKNSYGWWYIKNGAVDFSYTGVASNKNGLWYVKDGKVDFSTNGSITVGDETYSVTNGRVVGTLAVINGKTYYYDNSGMMATGWTELNGAYYYFDRSTGVMQTATTVDGIKLGSSGKANASSSDVVRIKTMIKARTRYLSLVSSGDSKSTQLRKCFEWVAKIPYNRYHYLSQEKSNSPNTWICTFANDIFDKGKGCCVSMASAFAYLANECGYTAYVCDDTSHSWTEINGLVYDPLFARTYGYTNFYGATYAQASGKIYFKNKTALY